MWIQVNKCRQIPEKHYPHSAAKEDPHSYFMHEWRKPMRFTFDLIMIYLAFFRTKNSEINLGEVWKCSIQSFFFPLSLRCSNSSVGFDLWPMGWIKEWPWQRVCPTFPQGPPAAAPKPELEGAGLPSLTPSPTPWHVIQGFHLHLHLHLPVHRIYTLYLVDIDFPVSSIPVCYLCLHFWFELDN